jgi:hypothetical protein
LSQRPQANSVIHPVTGKEMEYSALMKDPVSNHFGLEALATNVDACFRAFETFQEPTHVSSSSRKTSQMTERSLTEKLSAITNHTSKKRNAFGLP